MKFEELLTKVRGIAQKADASNTDFLAVQVNITGKDSGVFYGDVGKALEFSKLLK
jgi:hypothetical protein